MLGYCRSSCPSGKKAGSAGCGVDGGVCSKECKVNEAVHRRMRRLRTEAQWLCWRDVFVPLQILRVIPLDLRHRDLAFLTHQMVPVVWILVEYRKREGLGNSTHRLGRLRI